MSRWGIIIFIFFSVLTTEAYSDCAGGAINEIIEIIPQSCQVLTPEDSRLKAWLVKSKYPEEWKKDVLSHYYGALIKHNDQEYFYSTKNEFVCSLFEKGVKRPMVVEPTCCDGDPGSPCLLGYNIGLLVEELRVEQQDLACQTDEDCIFVDTNCESNCVFGRPVNKEKAQKYRDLHEKCGRKMVPNCDMGWPPPSVVCENNLCVEEKK